MKATLAILLILVLAPVAGAMPDDAAAPRAKREPQLGTNYRDSVIEARRRAREEYRRMREKRLEKIRLAAGESAGGANDEVPGWKDPTALVAPIVDEPDPESPPPVRGSRIFVLVTGIGVGLALLLRLLVPQWFGTPLIRLLRRTARERPERLARKKDGPVTITLGPRSNRGYAGN